MLVITKHLFVYYTFCWSISLTMISFEFPTAFSTEYENPMKTKLWKKIVAQKKFASKLESVPSEFPASPQPILNGANVYIAPIVYLRRLINQTDTKLMDAINHELNTSKLNDSELPKSVAEAVNSEVNRTIFQKLESPSSKLPASYESVSDDDDGNVGPATNLINRKDRKKSLFTIKHAVNVSNRDYTSKSVRSSAETVSSSSNATTISSDHNIDKLIDNIDNIAIVDKSDILIGNVNNEDSVKITKNANSSAAGDSSDDRDLKTNSDTWEKSDFLSLTLILLMVAVVSLYIGLVVWRRILENRYGNSEILLQEEYIDDGPYYIN